MTYAPKVGQPSIVVSCEVPGYLLKSRVVVSTRPLVSFLSHFSNPGRSGAPGGRRFYAKGPDFWQLATECRHCGLEKYADVTGIETKQWPNK
jgi:hypothetical protein